MYGNDRFKLLGIDGVKPTRDTIMRGEYPLEDNYYAVIRKDTPADHPARKLIDWILSDDGQILAAKAGYIPLREMDNIWSDDSIDPIYLGNTDNSSGTGGTELKTDVDGIQPVNGVRPPLSDIFNDGFNYIQYINAEIIKWVDSIDTESWGNPSQMEKVLKRPFTGIPNDYPNYEINYIGILTVSFPSDNPFFNQPVNIQIPLTENISPYGSGQADYTISYDFSGSILSGIDLFTLKVELKDKPDISARINEQLEVWTNTLPDTDYSKELLMDFIGWYKGIFTDGSEEIEWANYRLQPSPGLWRDYLSVSYILQTYDGPSGNMPMVFTKCFDINTGDIVQLSEKAAGEIDYANTYGFTRMDFNDLSEWGYPYQENLSEYTPPAGSVITGAWVMYDQLNIYLTEPDGRVLQFMVIN